MAAAMELLGSAPEAPYKAMPTNLEGQQRSNHVDTDQLCLPATGMVCVLAVLKNDTKPRWSNLLNPPLELLCSLDNLVEIMLL